MPDPLLLEVNTRCWLRELSEKANAAVTLGTVPEAELNRWALLGFTHVWPMGVWSTGPKSQASAQSQPYLQRLCDVSFGSHDSKIAASPFSISDYTVSADFGGEEGLSSFREKLREHGLKLILDFVPNHVGLDHPWLTSHPEYFISSAVQQPESFYQETALGPLWIAHGKDPYFAAWTDTAQLDYRKSATRDAMVRLLQEIAGRCDGVRCDMAMLLLNSVFRETWKAHPSSSAPSSDEFWPQAIAAIKNTHPDFLVLAEAYWNLEIRLQEAGFDYTYDKMFRDYLLNGEKAALEHHLEVYRDNRKMARFLENHDELPVASLLSIPDHRKALELLISQPGLRLIYNNQLYGKKLQTPVQLVQYRPEPLDVEVKQMYEDLLGGRRP